MNVRPDILEKFEKPDNPFFRLVKDATIKAAPPAPPEKFDVKILEDALDGYAKSFQGDELDILQYARISAKTAHSNRDSRHYLDLFCTFLLISLKKTFPSKDFKDVEKLLENLKKELANVLRNDNLDNDLFIPALLGMIQGLL